MINFKKAYWPGHVVAESLVEDTDDEDPVDLKGQVIPTSSNGSNHSNRPKNGPFSAIINSMIPEEAELRASGFSFDEFGFKIASDKDTDAPELLEKPHEPFTEDGKHKLKWIAYLEFNLNKSFHEKFSLKNVKKLEKSDKLRNLILSEGIPHSLRPFIWLRLSGALEKKHASTFKYLDLLEKCQSGELHTSKQIEKDLLRTLPTNICFSHMQSVGVSRLRRILQAIAWLYPSIGYCQGMGSIVATLLLFLEEEDVFWLMCTIIENLLPVSYYSHTLAGVQVDMRVLRELIRIYLPTIEAKLLKFDVEISLIFINWFLTLFSSVLRMDFLLRIWDVYFYEGSSIVLFQMVISLLKLNEDKFGQIEESKDNSIAVFNVLNEIPSSLKSINDLIELNIRLTSSITKNMIDKMRNRYFNEMGFKNTQQVYKHVPNEVNGTGMQKPVEKSSQKLTESDLDNFKMKNIAQTELLLNLHEVLVKIGAHFGKNDPKNYAGIEMDADYSIESHARDYEAFRSSSNSNVGAPKRARALTDFKGTERDELEFEKNDIITVFSVKDDHCWVGELNGVAGWFPAKFVQLVDERNGKKYSCAGDDSVDERVRDLIRGDLCLVLKSIFEYGLKKWTVLGGFLHPWTFIEQAVRKSVEKEQESVYSRLNLCRSFRLDEFDKVLQPDELLFKWVHTINATHDRYRAHMDVKFRSLICQALNEQCLHIWLEILCSNVDVVQKFYHSWSFLRSPGWVQIKCELRMLAQFSFNLSVNGELPKSGDLNVNESIRDMLIKHHLFSWDIN